MDSHSALFYALYLPHLHNLESPRQVFDLWKEARACELKKGIHIFDWVTKLISELIAEVEDYFKKIESFSNLSDCFTSDKNATLTLDNITGQRLSNQLRGNQHVVTCRFDSAITPHGEKGGYLFHLKPICVRNLHEWIPWGWLWDLKVIMQIPK